MPVPIDEKEEVTDDSSYGSTVCVRVTFIPELLT